MKGMSSKIASLDLTKFQRLTDEILGSNPDILGAYLLNATNRAVIAESVCPEFRKSLSGLSQTANGMVSQWNIAAFGLFQRLDSFRSKARYLVIGRDDLKGLIFPLPPSETIYVVLSITKAADAAAIYESVIAMVKNSVH